MLKKYHYAILWCSMPLFSAAQPSLSASDIHTVFTSILYNTPSNSFSPGNSGPNQTWDYSNLSLPPIGAFNLVPSSTGSFSGTFTQSNLCYNFDPDAPNINYYYYLRTSSTAVEQLGFVSNDAIIKNFNSNPKKTIQFPYTYNTTFTDTYQSNTDSAPTTVTVTYDAYGTLILPFGTFQNVIRQKFVENGVTNYKWINTNPFYYILETYFESNTISITKSTTVLSIEETSKNDKFFLTPNPFTDKFTITADDTSLTNFSVLLYDSLGRLVKKQEVEGFNSQMTIEVDLADAMNGLYIAKIVNTENKTVATSKIIKKTI